MITKHCSRRQRDVAIASYLSPPASIAATVVRSDTCSRSMLTLALALCI
jgi:hypothetical protein